jgi:ABC-type spermidine/putrescine transport system permease subunit II
MSSFDNVPVSQFLRDPRTDILLIRMCQNLEGKLDVTITAPSTVQIALALLAVIMERPAGLSRRIT